MSAMQDVVLKEEVDSLTELNGTLSQRSAMVNKENARLLKDNLTLCKAAQLVYAYITSENSTTTRQEVIVELSNAIRGG